jgi:hypothetical protein
MPLPRGVGASRRFSARRFWSRRHLRSGGPSRTRPGSGSGVGSPSATAPSEDGDSFARSPRDRGRSGMKPGGRHREIPNRGSQEFRVICLCESCSELSARMRSPPTPSRAYALERKEIAFPRTAPCRGRGGWSFSANASLSHEARGYGNVRSGPASSTSVPGVRAARSHSTRRRRTLDERLSRRIPRAQ